MGQQKSVTSHDFPDRLKMLMDSRGLKSSDLGRLIGIDRAYVSMLRNGKRENPSADIIAKLSHAFNVSSEFLLTGKDTFPPKSVTRTRSGTTISHQVSGETHGVVPPLNTFLPLTPNASAAESSMLQEEPAAYNASPPEGGWERMFQKAVHNATTDWLIESLVGFNKAADDGDEASRVAIAMISNEIRSRAANTHQQTSP